MTPTEASQKRTNLKSVSLEVSGEFIRTKVYVSNWFRPVWLLIYTLVRNLYG